MWSQVVFSITTEQVKTIRTYLDPLAGAFIVWLVKKWIKKAQDSFHSIITDNANRIKEEIVKYVDLKLQAHEESEKAWILGMIHNEQAIVARAKEDELRNVGA